MPVNDNLKIGSVKHIKLEIVVEILKANETIVTLEEAAKTLDLMGSLVKIAANNNVSNNKKVGIHFAIVRTKTFLELCFPAITLAYIKALAEILFLL